MNTFALWILIALAVWSLIAIKQLKRKVNKMAKTLDDALAAVTAESTKIDSLIALFGVIEQQLKDALSGENLSPAAQAKVDAIFDQATGARVVLGSNTRRRGNTRLSLRSVDLPDLSR